MRGFTLAELLIALAILGEIATFTIPKIINSQQNGRNNAVTKESIAMVSAAYSQYQLDSGRSASMTPGALTGYMNYVKVDTAGTAQIDDDYGGSSPYTCSSTSPCLSLHNGGKLFYIATDNFGGTNSTNAIWFLFDPDGKITDGTTNSMGSSIWFALYYNGRVSTYSTITSNTVSGYWGSYNPCSNCDPPWFHW